MLHHLVSRCEEPAEYLSAFICIRWDISMLGVGSFSPDKNRVGTSDSSLGYRRRLSPNHVVYGLRRRFFFHRNFLNRRPPVPRKASRRFCFSMLINKHKGIVSTGSHTLFRRVMHLFFCDATNGERARPSDFARKITPGVSPPAPGNATRLDGI